MSARQHPTFRRRHFLKAAGGAAALAPFVPLLSAEAETEGAAVDSCVHFEVHDGCRRSASRPLAWGGIPSRRLPAALVAWNREGFHLEDTPQ